MPPVKREQFLANWSSQARKGLLELIVMSVLARREFYGYELVEHILSRTGFEVSDGTLYTILTRLKSDGLVNTRWEAAERGPARKYYALTKEGRAVLSSMQGRWADIAHGVAEALAIRGEGDV
jgi:PadR family transcriptional regulator, regulatory protein PadR